MKPDHILIPHTRINSKWIKDLNVRTKTIKIIEENIGSKISDITCSNILLDISPQTRKTKEKISKCDYIKLKCFCTTKEIINKIKRQPTESENIFTDTSGKRSISKIYLKNTQNLTPNLKNLIKKMDKEPE